MLRATSFILLVVPTSAIFACLRDFRTLNNCHKSAEGCEDCKILALSNPFSDGFCNAANDSLCNARGCCESCEEQFEAYETCLDKVTLFNCDLDCDVAPTPSPIPQPPPEDIPGNEGIPGSEGELENELAEELENQGCLAKFGAFAQCAAQNPLVCGGCLLENLPDDITNGGFCNMATEAICGFGTCCEPCTPDFEEFDECFERIVADVTFGACEIDCDDFEAPEDDQDSLAGCGDSLQEYATCVQENPRQCALCIIQNFPNPDDGFCQSAGDSLCGLGACCTPCAEKFEGFESCLQTLSSTVTLGECEIDCDTDTSGSRALRGTSKLGLPN